MLEKQIEFFAFCISMEIAKNLFQYGTEWFHHVATSDISTESILSIRTLHDIIPIGYISSVRVRVCFRSQVDILDMFFEEDAVGVSAAGFKLNDEQRVCIAHVMLLFHVPVHLALRGTLSQTITADFK